MSAHLLVSLADGADWTTEAVATERVVSLAEQFAAEPEWKGEKSEVTVDSDLGACEFKS